MSDTPISEILNNLPVFLNVLGLVFLSAVFSGAETAFTNLSPAKMEVIKGDGKFASKLMYKLYQKLDLVITLTLILSNGVNFFLATYLTVFFIKIFGTDLGSTLSVSLGTVLVIIFGEILPKKFAILYPASFSRGTTHLLQYLKIIMFPILYPLQLLNLGLDKFAAKIKTKNEEEDREMLQEEIKATLGMGHVQGALESKEYQMMQKLLLLNDKEAKDIMTHRSDIIAINSQKTLKDLIQLASENSFSRIPVYTESIENIDYIIHIPQLGQYLTDAKNLDRPIVDFCKSKAFRIPESKIIDDLFFEFQKKRVHMAIVLNEFGETGGLITLEDIVEEIFGEIEDETDNGQVSIEMIDSNKARSEGDVSLERVEDLLNIKFPEEYPKHKTISWLILDILHRFPKTREKIMVPETNIEIEVVDKDGEYIDEVNITILDPSESV